MLIQHCSIRVLKINYRYIDMCTSINVNANYEKGDSMTFMKTTYILGCQKKIIFLRKFEKKVHRHFAPKLLTYFSRPQIFGKFIKVWGLLLQYDATGAPRTRKFFANLGLKKTGILYLVEK